MDKFEQLYRKIISEMNYSLNGEKNLDDVNVSVGNDFDNKSESDSNVDYDRNVIYGSFNEFVDSLLNKNKNLFQRMIKQIINSVYEIANKDPEKCDFAKKDIESSINYVKFLETIIKDESSYINFVKTLTPYVKLYWPERNTTFESNLISFLWAILEEYGEKNYNIVTLTADCDDYEIRFGEKA